jgi:uroporphyrin-III C-methyltransferase/precorrin-2 dehydrogenase/sirohydrochlorin ferrochelatase
MQQFPIFLNLAGRKVLVAGGGQALAARLRFLKSADADISVFAEALDPELAALAESGAFNWHSRNAVPSDFENCALAFIGTGDLDMDHRMSGMARATGVTVNVLDRPELSDFIMPAIVERGPVTAAISTGGMSPTLAQIIRREIESILPARTGAIAEFANRFRDVVRAMIPISRARRSFWREALTGPIADEVLAGKTDNAARRLMQKLNRSDAAPNLQGRILIFATAPEISDAVRAALIDVDVIIHDATVTEAMLGCARRDAERIAFSPSISDAELYHRLAALADDSKTIVCLVDPTLEEALRGQARANTQRSNVEMVFDAPISESSQRLVS